MADGCFIPATAFAQVRIPDQRALIHYANGTETLVIDTAFQGAGTNFAWIIPVPSLPTVEAASPGLFPTLEGIFHPRVIHGVQSNNWAVLIMGGYVLLLIWHRRLGLRLYDLLLAGFFLVIMVGLMSPALSRSDGANASSVQVLGRQTVDVYETATVSSRDGSALVQWLTQNGFPTPTNHLPAIRAYAQEGWFFVASRIRLDTSMTQAAKPHPLTLRFKTDRPVYPLRLTGIENDPCRIELFVFGPAMAGIPHFTVERATAPDYPEAPEGNLWMSEMGVRILHPLLRSLVAGAPAATKLTGVLSSRQMEQDGYITWQPLTERQLTLYTKQGAAQTAANISAPIFILFLLVSSLAVARRTAGARAIGRMFLLAALVSTLVGTLCYFSFSRTAAFVTHLPTVRNRQLHETDIPTSLQSELTALNPRVGPPFPPSLEWVRQCLAQNSPFRTDAFARDQTNNFTGQPWREEDSPGNYTLRQMTNGIECTWYDFDGAAHSDLLFTPKKDRER